MRSSVDPRRGMPLVAAFLALCAFAWSQGGGVVTGIPPLPKAPGAMPVQNVVRANPVVPPMP